MAITLHYLVDVKFVVVKLIQTVTVPCVGLTLKNIVKVSGMARRIRQVNISLDEINVQIALGTLTKPEQIATFIEFTKDIRALIWASKHKNHKIRESAVSNPICPISILVKAGIRDKSSTVVHSAQSALEDRSKEVDDFLLVTESYPQLSFPFRDTEKVIIEEPLTEEDDERC